eukprot:gene2568-2607_t
MRCPVRLVNTQNAFFISAIQFVTFLQQASEKPLCCRVWRKSASVRPIGPDAQATVDARGQNTKSFTSGYRAANAFDISTDVEIDLDTVTKTSYGDLTTHIGYEADSGASNSYNGQASAYIDEAYLTFAGLTAGRKETLFQTGLGSNGYNHSGIRSSTPVDGNGTALVANGGRAPDVVAQLKVKQGWGEAGLTGGFHNNALNFGGFNRSSQRFGAYNDLSLSNPQIDYVLGHRQSGFNVIADLKHNWTPNVSTEVSGSYGQVRYANSATLANAPGAAFGYNVYAIGQVTKFVPVKGLEFGIDTTYIRYQDKFGAAQTVLINSSNRKSSDFQKRALFSRFGALMPHRRMTFSKYMIERTRQINPVDADLTALLNDVQTACKQIAQAVSRGALNDLGNIETTVNVQGEDQKPLDVLSNQIMLETCEFGGQVCGMASEEMDEPYQIPPAYPRGRYLLIFDPLDGSSNIDVNVTVGTIFSILRAPDGVTDPTTADFLQKGAAQVAAGFALYGPSSMLILTLGAGVQGFTFDREIGSYMLTHPQMKIPETTREFAINASNARFWEPPVRRYVGECVAGRSGPRAKDFNMRWIASMVVEIYRILMRGGLFMYPRDNKDPSKPGRLRLMYEANPISMIVEQAGGLASTGRERLLDVQPTDLHQRVPVIVGSKEEVERLVAYHAAFDAGDEAGIDSPLVNELFHAD